MNQGQTYTIRLPQFEGPFDLLLFFIERDELDINNIAISKIADDFLTYIRQMEALNVDLASEFILVAATLMRIKAKLLLPRKAIDEAGNEIDPRQELVDRLLEYKRYKSVLEELREFEKERSLREYRGNTSRELKEIATKALVDVEMESLTLFKLLKVYEQVMHRFDVDANKATVHTIMNYSYTIQQQQEYLFENLKKGEKTSFQSIFGVCQNRIHAIVMFLGLLELLNLQQISILQGEGINNFWLSLPDEAIAENESTENVTVENIDNEENRPNEGVTDSEDELEEIEE
jgi:segregation and condensation protein A